MRATTDLYCAIEFISVIKASRFVTIEVDHYFGYGDKTKFVSNIIFIIKNHLSMLVSVSTASIANCYRMRLDDDLTSKL